MILHPINRGLAAAVLVVAIPAFWPHAQPTTPQRLTTLRPADVGVIEITQADSRLSIRLDKINDHWELTSPVSAPADAIGVTGPLLGVLRSESHGQYSLNGIDIAKIGLAPPLWQVRYGELRLQFGGTDPVQGWRYVRVGDTIHRISDVDEALFDADYSDLVSRRLIPDGRRPVAIGAAGSGNPVVSDWDLAALASPWQRAQALTVRRAERADYARASGGVQITLDDGDTLTYRITPLEGGLGLIRPDLDLLYVLPRSARSELLPAPARPTDP